MKLSYVLKYTKSLDDFNKVRLQQDLHEYVHDLNLVMDLHEIDFGNLKTLVRNDLKAIDAIGSRVYNNLNSLQEKLNAWKLQYRNEYYKLSDKIYEESLNDDADYIITRSKRNNLFVVHQSQNTFIGRLSVYADFHWPAVQIRPLNGLITDKMKANDPLYIVDTSESLFKEVKAMFAPQYQRRLRYYTVNEKQKHPLHRLPQRQIGLVVAVDFFNFKPIHIVEKYLKSCWEILRPGGIMMFTFNNGDSVEGARNVEAHFNTYVPSSDLITILHKIGYEVIAEFNLDKNLSWFEIRKPGELQSMRLAQTFATIEKLSD
jgi:SAM-dependent methyltransferase